VGTNFFFGAGFAALAAGDKAHYNTTGAFFVDGEATKCKYQGDAAACDLLLHTLDSEYA
jgi:hypothetical protein